jgi:hypothetical protein
LNPGEIVDALPAEIRQELVMSTAARDGHAVTTYRLKAAERPEPLLETMRARWRAQGVPFVESRQGDWTILSVRDAGGYRTVQLRATGSGTEGLSSRWHRPADRPAAANDPVDVPAVAPQRWLPAQSTVLRRIAHRDPGRDAATVVAVVPERPAQVARELHREAARDGFVVDPAVGMPAQGAAWYRGTDGVGRAIAWRRGREEVVATLDAHRDGTAVVMHWGAAR